MKIMDNVVDVHIFEEYVYCKHKMCYQSKKSPTLLSIVTQADCTYQSKCSFMS